MIKGLGPGKLRGLSFRVGVAACGFRVLLTPTITVLIRSQSSM